MSHLQPLAIAALLGCWFALYKVETDPIYWVFLVICAMVLTGAVVELVRQDLRAEQSKRGDK